ncbi:MAG TPA: hypothetical protein VMW43_12355 [Bacteroidota bacterium]|nr:hypothetical protein [Bacteroidota bacterium]
MTVSDLEDHLGRNPRSTLFARLANEYIALARIDDAVALCMHGLSLYPRYGTAHLVLARCYAAESNFALALSSLEDARQCDTFLPAYEPLAREWNRSMSAPPAPADASSGEAEAGERTAVAPAETEEPEATTDNKAEETPADIEVREKSAVEEAPEAPAEKQEEIAAAETEERATPADAEVPETTAIKTDAQSASPRETTPAVQAPLPSMPPVVFQPMPPALPPPGPGQAPPPAQPAPTVEGESSPPGTPPSSRPEDVISDEERAQIESHPYTEDDRNRIVSRTLAEIYANQEEFEEAIVTYALLIKQKPEFREQYEKRIEELRIAHQQKLQQQTQQ